MERRLSVPGRYDRLEQISNFIEQAGREADLDEDSICRCQLAVDEACTNIIEHGYQGEDRGSIQIACQPSSGELTIIIRDQARPFDPHRIPQPKLSASVDEMQIGGLGIYFMRQVMDAVEFSYENGSNQLVLVKKRDE